MKIHVLMAACAAFAAQGAEWTLLRTETKAVEQAVSFCAAAPETGYVSGIGSIVRSNNGGKSWKQVVNRQTFDGPYWFNSIAALSPEEAVASAFIYGKPKGGLVVRTADGGNSWQKADIPGNGDVKFSGVAFTPDGKTGYVLGEGAGLYVSTDRGASWTAVKLPLRPDRFWIASKRIISLPDNQTVILWGGRNCLVRSDDAGKSWKRQEIKIPNVNFDLGTDVYFSSPQRGWVFSGWDGQRAETSDGGKTWIPSRAPAMVHMAPDGRHGWSYNPRNYEVFESTDGGATWGNPETLSGGKGGISMMAVSGDYVYAVGGQEGAGISVAARRLLPGKAEKAQAPSGVVPLSFTLPAPGTVSIQILDAQGGIVEHLADGASFPAGKNTIHWNLSTLEDFWFPFEKNNPHQYTPPPDFRKVAPPGRYTWRGMFHPELSLRYRDCYYPIKPSGIPWPTPDHTGGWLGDHEPPNDVIDGGESMWLGAFAEGGDSLLECTLDMEKKWGVSRIQLACARVLARDGGKLFFLDVGGWLGHGKQLMSIIELDAKSKKSRRLVTVPTNDPAAVEFTQSPESITSGKFSEISGFAVVGNRAYLSDQGRNRILVLDIAENLAGKTEKINISARIELPAPGRVRPYDAKNLAIACKNALYLLNVETQKATRIAEGLSNAYGLAIDAEGNFYVGELEPLHLVKVFDKAGKLVRTIGKEGKHKIGPFDPQNLESPTGLAIDARGNLWVAEHSFELKRSSVWDRNGVCIRSVFGPTEYGGGGAVDPRNPNRFFYRGNEIFRGADGKYTLKNVFWRHDATEFISLTPERRPHNFNGPAPAYPFYRGNQLFFRAWGGYAMGDVTTLFVYDEARKCARPVAGAGMIQPWMRKAFSLPADHTIFGWTDLDDDGKIASGELRTAKFAKLSAVWGCTMGENFDVAFSTPGGPVELAFFEVEKLTNLGYPVYRLPESLRTVPNFSVRDPHQVQSVRMDAQGNAVAVAPYIFSMNKSGKLNWRYKSRWPGLHSGLGSTALGNEPGVILAPLRIWGIEEDAVFGSIIAVGTNYGVVDFLSGEGFYLGRAFVDSRLGNSWRFEKAPTTEELKKTSLGQEHFGGAYQKVNGKHTLIVAGGGNSSVVINVEGFEGAKKLSGGTFTVSPAQFAAADAIRQSQQSAAQIEREYTLTAGRDWKNKKAIEGFKLGYDDKNLYLLFQGTDDMAPFRNSATENNLAEAFTTGDVIDLMLARDPAADPNRKDAARGDLRISIVPWKEGARVLLYDYVAPGAPEEKKLRFSSPTGGCVVDRFALIENAAVAVRRSGNRVEVEATIPFDSIGLSLRPGMRLRGDVGRVLSDQTGSTRIDRVYWSCRNTRIVSDLPSEARLQPNLWGTFLVQ